MITMRRSHTLIVVLWRFCCSCWFPCWCYITNFFSTLRRSTTRIECYETVQQTEDSDDMNSGGCGYQTTDSDDDDIEDCDQFGVVRGVELIDQDGYVGHNHSSSPSVPFFDYACDCWEESERITLAEWRKVMAEMEFACDRLELPNDVVGDDERKELQRSLADLTRQSRSLQHHWSKKELAYQNSIAPPRQWVAIRGDDLWKTHFLVRDDEDKWW
eukprot:TRINITY_DN67072_c4_g1_i8.p1 TRINITY_DN67072_c4_g1~~TRINITY_DN67072_c4_g1_i8.p1  ORF type:complete len:251 (-),score=49.74 TRINITY_DN67072_c4_g1_i8:165-809(-)